MPCPSCGFANPEGMKFCGGCGAPLPNPCPQCGFENPPPFKFCGACGTPLSDRPAGSRPAHPLQPPVPEAQRALHVALPEHLAEKILASRRALEGERKQVTVLFADIKDSTELIRDLDPEAAQQLLDPAIHRMMQAVHRYEGTVNQVLGDGIMALFGAPIAHEDHAVRACYAALAMQTAMSPLADEGRQTYGVEMQLRVGLNSGEVVVRTIGNDLHMDYSAVGATTHLAARMEQQARPGSIRFPVSTLRLVEGLVRVHALGPVSVKGMRDPVEVYELLGANAIRRRLQAAASRGLTRFIGREIELELLDQALERAGTGQGQVVAAVGEAGVGKSRLVYEFLHSPCTQGWRVLESASVSYGKATPYFPLIELLKRYSQIEDGDDARTVRAKLTGQVLTLDESLHPLIPALLWLLDVLPDDSPFLRLDPPERRQRTLEALKRVLLRESQVQPVLLVCEDLHWIDSETQALLDSLVESLPAAAVLLLVNYRPEYQHGWGSKTYYTQLRLDPLPPLSAAALLQDVLGDDASLATLKPLLIARTQGNPFFLEESVRTLVETGALVGEHGAYRLVAPPEALQVPATVQAILAARMDRLGPEDKLLLQTAAVIGTEVPLGLLGAVAELPDTEVQRGLLHLQAAEYLYETQLFPELVYTFKHALTHEVAYGSLLQERRRVLRGRIVEVLEGLGVDRLSEQVERLAQHAVRGAVWDRAVRYSRQAGSKALARSANREAAAHFEQALTALAHLPESRDHLIHAIDLRLDLWTALIPLSELARSLAVLQEATSLADTLGEPRWLGWCLMRMSDQLVITGDYDRALAAGQRALDMARTCDDFTLQVATENILGRLYNTLGDHRRAVGLLKETAASLTGASRTERFGLAGFPAVVSRAFIAWSLADLGAFAEGRRYGTEALQMAEPIDHAFSLVVALVYGMGHLCLCQGDLHSAIPLLARGLEVCQTRQVLLFFPITAAHLGYAYTLAGQVSEGLPLLEQAVTQATTIGVTARQSLAAVWLSEGYLRAGRLADAINHAEQALRLARMPQERGTEAYALRFLGEIASQGDVQDAKQADTHYRQALALAETLGMRPLQAHCHLGLGTLYSTTGKVKPARTELNLAIDLYRRMQMAFWLPRAEAALAQVEAP